MTLENTSTSRFDVFVKIADWPCNSFCLRSSIENSFRVILQVVERIGDSTNCESLSESISLFSERKKSTRPWKFFEAGYLPTRVGWVLGFLSLREVLLNMLVQDMRSLL